TFTQVGTVAANVKTYSSTGLTAATLYYFRVLATNTGGSSAASNTASGTTLPLAPAAPSGLTATVASSSTINLAWTDNSTNETGFTIQRSTYNVTFTQVGTVGANVNTYASTALSPATPYYFRVLATNTGGTSAASNTASG